MATEKTPRKLHCKHAHIDPPGPSLQLRLAAALADRAIVMDRAEPLSATECRIIAQHYPVGGGIAGIFTAFARGASAVSVLDDPAAQTLSLDQIKAPPGDDGKERQWVDGLLYFYVHGDTVILIQSAALRAGQFEAHLSWLLKPAGNGAGPSVRLADQYGRSALEQIATQHVKDVVVGGPLLQGGVVPVVAEQPQVRTRFEVGGRMLEALQSVLELDRAPGFDWQAGLDGNIEAWLHVSYRRRTNEDAQRLLDRIALALRNAEDLETVITLNNGQKIEGDALKLSRNCRIESREGVLLAEQAFAAMAGWHKELVETRQFPV